MKRTVFILCCLTVMLSAFHLPLKAEMHETKEGEESLYVGETKTISLAETFQETYRKSGVTVVSYKWTLDDSNKSKISIVSSDRISATIKGLQAVTKARLYYKSEYFYDSNSREMNFYYEITVMNRVVKVSRIDISPSSLSLTVGSSQPLSCTIYPTNATNKVVKWFSNATDVAYVDSRGTVTAKKAGSATISCMATDGSGVKDTCSVTVKEPTIDVKDISVYPSKTSVAIGDSVQLTANISPPNATDKTVTWSASHLFIFFNATVDKNGMVKGVRAGSSTITATAHNGMSASCSVTVYKRVFEDCLDEFCMTYRVLDYEKKICQVGEFVDNQEQPAIDDCSEGSLVIPENCKDYQVTRIGGGAFYGCMITSVEIPASVSEIGDGAFRSCSNLWNVSIKGSSVSVAEDAFEGVGSEDEPCIIEAPDNFDFGVDTSGNCFKWKGGYFILDRNYISNKANGYAVLSADQTSLTFYCDNAWNQKGGLVFNLNKDGENPEWLKYGNNVTEVYFDISFEEARPRTTYRWFYGMTNLCNVHFGKNWYGSVSYDFSRTTNTQEMFANCTSLQSVDLSPIGESWNLTNASGMFKNCSQLENVVLFNIHKTCPCCPGDILPILPVQPQPIDISYMFYGCKSLRNVPPSGLFSKPISNATSLFQGCESLGGVDLHNMVFSSTVPNDHLLAGCISLKYVIVGSSATHLADNAFYDVGEMSAPCCFYAPEGTSFGVSASGSFSFKGGYFITGTPHPYAILYKDSGNGRLTFYYDSKMLDREGSYFLIENGPHWNDNSYHEYSTVSFDTSFKNYKPTSLSGWFWGQHSITAFEQMENLDTSEVTDMGYLFGGFLYTCVGVWGNPIKSLDVSHFDTSKVINMEGMFQGCGDLTSLDVSHFDTSNVKNMSYMFDGCNSLTSLDLSHFDTSNVTDMSGMFLGCLSLKELDVSNFNTSKVKDSDKMFSVGLQNDWVDIFEDENLSCLKTLILSPTMTHMSEEACLGIGCTYTYEYDEEVGRVYEYTFDRPVDIYAPKGFDFGVDTTGDSFFWKGGYFHLVKGIAVASSVSVKPGGNANLTLGLKNGDEVLNGYEFTLILPEGVSLTVEGDDYDYALSDRYSKEGMRVSITNPSPGEYHLVCFSFNNVTLTGKEGPVVTLSIESENQMSDGTYSVILKDFVCYDTEGEDLDVSGLDIPIYVSSFDQGDVNHDGKVNVADVMLVANELLGTDNAAYHPENSDMDGNGFVDVADIVRIVDAMLTQPRKMVPAHSIESIKVSD